MPRSFGLLRSVGVRRGHEAAALMKRRKPGMSIPMQRDGRLGFCDYVVDAAQPFVAPSGATRRVRS